MDVPRIKICGITTPDALGAAIKARADYVGFMFYPPSPRYLAPRDAVDLAARAGKQIARVGVFVNASDPDISEALEAGKLDIVQLHGSETPARVAQVKARFGLPVWKVLSVSCAANINTAAQYHGIADFILFDAKTPKGALPGGMGLAFDWSLLAGYRGISDWGLAGGLNANNVGDAIRITGTPLVDTSSGVESAPGVKDTAMIAAFCAAVRT